LPAKWSLTLSLCPFGQEKRIPISRSTFAEFNYRVGQYGRNAWPTGVMPRNAHRVCGPRPRDSGSDPCASPRPVNDYVKNTGDSVDHDETAGERAAKIWHDFVTGPKIGGIIQSRHSVGRGATGLVGTGEFDDERRARRR
jgi:hypothetical protein